MVNGAHSSTATDQSKPCCSPKIESHGTAIQKITSFAVWVWKRDIYKGTGVTERYFYGLLDSSPSPIRERSWFKRDWNPTLRRWCSLLPLLTQLVDASQGTVPLPLLTSTLNFDAPGRTRVVWACYVNRQMILQFAPLFIPPLDLKLTTERRHISI